MAYPYVQTCTNLRLTANEPNLNPGNLYTYSNFTVSKFVKYFTEYNDKYLISDYNNSLHNLRITLYNMYVLTHFTEHAKNTYNFLEMFQKIMVLSYILSHFTEYMYLMNTHNILTTGTKIKQLPEMF